MSKILVTGGAGYIGSHICRMLTERGHEVVVVDNLSVGHRQAVAGLPLVVSDFGDAAMLDEQLGRGGVDVVMHMAASCEVGESVTNPAFYYRNNVMRSLELLDAAQRHGVRGIVFSSTAATYGEPSEIPISEDHPQAPTNPYGETKLAIERALSWFQRAYGLNFVALRYFNAAGAHPDGTIGEDHEPESHLIPRLLGAALGPTDPIPIFGTDYPTPDGTCVRDYIHVLDLAQAHVLAMEALLQGEAQSEAFNLGNGEGFSVRQVVETTERVTGGRVPTAEAPRRPGDPATLVASSERIAQRLGWRPEHPDLEQIVQNAWNWHRLHPQGYGDRSG
jgi:UDP-glucose 4-epimerase